MSTKSTQKMQHVADSIVADSNDVRRAREVAARRHHVVTEEEEIFKYVGSHHNRNGKQR